MFAYEDTHWWFRGKRSVVASMLERFSPAQPGRRALDVGCGTGANLELLARYGEAHGIDVSPLALGVRLAERRRFGDGQARSSLRRPPPVVNGMLAAVYGLEAGLLRYTSLPFGLSVLVVARKPA